MDLQRADFDPAEIPDILHALIGQIGKAYIFPDIGAQIGACLQKHLEEGEYAGIEEGELFALALTLHLQDLSHDEHLWVRFHPEPLPDQDEQLRLNPGWMEERRLEARLDNYGLHRAERLPGNVGYLDIRYFHPLDWGREAAITAMTFLAQTSALILDLRKCEGGYPAMIAFLSSYLFDPAPVHLSSIYWRDEDALQEFWTSPEAPGRRFVTEPVYVLTSRATFSGGEGFAYDLQALGRAVLVGEKTDGGAHPGASFRLHPHFEAFIPIGRPINPITGTNWEGMGVLPDILVPQEQAFSTAYRLALENIIAGNIASPARPQRRLAEEAQAALLKTG